MQCSGYGSYLEVQHNDQAEPTCVDTDGFQYIEPTITGPSVTCEKLPWETAAAKEFEEETKGNSSINLTEYNTNAAITISTL
jgi:hypothetical protein